MGCSNSHNDYWQDSRKTTPLFRLLGARFWDFCPARETLRTDRVQHVISQTFWPHLYRDSGIRPQNCKYYEIWEYERPGGAYPLHDSYEIFRVCWQFHGRLMFQIWEFDQGVPKLWGLTSAGAFSSKFSAPLAAKLYVTFEDFVIVLLF